MEGIGIGFTLIGAAIFMMSTAAFLRVIAFGEWPWDKRP